MAEEPRDRRAFFRRGLRTLLDTVSETVKATRGLGGGRPAPAPLRRLRPPGALPEADFLAACTRCDDCVSACPAACIVRVPSGEADAGTPVIVPDARACVLCSGLNCTRVCEPGALRPLHAPEQVRIGVAVVDRDLCYPWIGSYCSACLSICPTEPKAIVVDEQQRPGVDSALCTGCGLCEERCPTVPRAVTIQVVDRLLPRPAAS